MFVAGLILDRATGAVFVCTLGSAGSTGGRGCSPRGWRRGASWPRRRVGVRPPRCRTRASPGGAELVPAVFLTVVVTIAVYGLTAARCCPAPRPVRPRPAGPPDPRCQPAGRRRGQGGARQEGFRVLLDDTDADSVAAAPATRASRCYQGNVLTERALEDLDLHGIGRMLDRDRQRRGGGAGRAALLGRSSAGPRCSRCRSSRRGERRPAGRRGAARVPARDPRARLRRSHRSSSSAARRCGRDVGDPGGRTPTADSAHRVPLFCVKPDGQLEVATTRPALPSCPGDRVISFVPAPPEQPSQTRPARRTRSSRPRLPWLRAAMCHAFRSKSAPRRRRASSRPASHTRSPSL